MIEIKSEHRDSYSGQNDFRLIATLDGDFAGSLDYSTYHGGVAVQLISVLPSKRRKGVGTALVMALQETYPDQAIMFGITTTEGTALLNSMEWRTEENEAVTSAAKDIAVLTQKLRDYERRAEELLKLDSSERAAALEAMADWNDITDRVEELENIMHTQPPHFRYLVIQEKSALAFGI